MLHLYTLFIHIYIAAIKLSIPFNRKAKDWVNGRIKQAALVLPKSDIWVHCASLGEYEQIRPVLRKVRKTWPDKKICLSFFSPSGYEHVVDSGEFSFKAYIPADTYKNAEKFITQIQPEFVIFTKNDFWYNHINELKKRKIPFITVSSTVRSGAFYLKAYAKVFKGILKAATRIFVQDEMSLKRLTKAGFDQVVLAGDTRVDQVVQIAGKSYRDEIVQTFKANDKLIILASTHFEDDKIYMPILKSLVQKAKILIAPHDIRAHRMRELTDQLPTSFQRYSQAQKSVNQESRIMILDNMGKLASLYRYSDVVYIGGGFGAGIHNTLEPAAYGLPICFGPNHTAYKEAIYFIQHYLAVIVKDEITLYNALIEGLEIQKIDAYKDAYQRYFKIFGGGSDKILAFIQDSHLLS